MIKVDYLLAELRCASLRCRLLASEIDAIGIALKAGIVTPDEALMEMQEIGMLRNLGEVYAKRRNGKLVDTKIRGA